MKVVYVVAGNFAQFKHFMREMFNTNMPNYTHPHIVYVSEPRMLYGRHYEEGDKVVSVGTYYERKDLSEINDRLRAMGFTDTGLITTTELVRIQIEEQLREPLPEYPSAKQEFPYVPVKKQFDVYKKCNKKESGFD